MFGFLFLKVFVCAGSLGDGCEFSGNCYKQALIPDANAVILDFFFLLGGVRVRSAMGRPDCWGLRAWGGRVAGVWVLLPPMWENGARGGQK